MLHVRQIITHQRQRTCETETLTFSLTGLVVVVGVLHTDVGILQNFDLLVVSYHLHSQRSTKSLPRRSRHCGPFEHLGIHLRSHFHHSSCGYMGQPGCGNIHDESKHLVGHHRVRLPLYALSNYHTS
jgi:hypothetical protein